jgi:hypothetical protein
LFYQVTNPSTESVLPTTTGTVDKKVPTTVGTSTDFTGTSTVTHSSEGEVDKNTSEGESKTQLAPYIGIAIGAILLILILIVIVLYRRYVCNGFVDTLIFFFMFMCCVTWKN